MNKITVGIISACSLLIAGCATVPPPAPVKDLEPILVGQPISERITETEIEITNQIGLLYKLNEGAKLSPNKVVVHNTNVDARLNSKMTIPQSYSKAGVKVEEDRNWTALKDPSRVDLLEHIKVQPEPQLPPPPPDPLKTRVGKIQWDNNSLNKLVSNIGKALNKNGNYQLIVKRGKVSDLFITFKAENATLEEVILSLKKEMENFAEITLDKENKILSLVYKQ